MRSLERKIAQIVRGVAVKVAEAGHGEGAGRDRGRRPRTTSGPPRSATIASSGTRTRASRRGSHGRPVGGAILFIEATQMPGTGKLIADRAARRRDEGERAGRAVATCARTRTASASSRSFLEKSDVHIHVPAGAMPKDGPSAGDHAAHGARLALHRDPRPARRGDDRGDHAPRTRPADRRAQGEGPRRPPRGDQAGHHPRPEPRGHRGDPERSRGSTSSSSRSAGSTRWSRRRSNDRRCRDRLRRRGTSPPRQPRRPPEPPQASLTARP